MATKYGGYMDVTLDIDLTTITVGKYDIPDEDRRKFIGGKALAAKVLYDNLPAGVDPLAPENIMVFMTGPLTGTGAPCSSRFDVSTKNVLTYGIASSNCGGTFGMKLKHAGCDGLILRGKAEKPTILVVTEDGVEFVDARDLWGADTEVTQEKLIHRYGRSTGMVVIGPAGENLVRYACIISGERAAGRCGVGAVMGSKNIKAIVAWGAKEIPVHNPAKFKAGVKDWVHKLRAHPVTGGSLPAYGTAGLLNTANLTGTLPTRNFSGGTHPEAWKVSGDEMARNHLVSNTGCVSCPIRCARQVKVEGKVVKGPEFETLGLFGPNIDASNIQKIFDWNYKMDLLGMDTITCGSTIALAMELSEKGMWNNGLSFGRIEEMDTIFDDIAYRRGIGNDLAEGTLRIAAKYGGSEFAMHAKGMEFAAYEPRRAVGHGLGYATSNRGGCHINGGYLIYFEAIGPVLMGPQTRRGKPEFCALQQNLMEAVSMAGNCIFTTYAFIPGATTKFVPPASTMARITAKVLEGSGAMMKHQSRLLTETRLPLHVPIVPHTSVLTALTGMNLDLGHFAVAGERGFNLERMFNHREGLTSTDDALPKRLTDIPQVPDRPDTVVPLRQLLDDYYIVRDWDKNGLPTERVLKRLGLEFTYPDLHKAQQRAATGDNDGMKRFAGEAERFQRIYQAFVTQNAQIEENRPALEKEVRRELAIARGAKIYGAQFSVDAARCRSCGLCSRACPAGAVNWVEGCGHAEIDSEKCIGCGKCYFACPRNFCAIKLEKSAARRQSCDMTAYEISADKCKSCGMCAKKCPTGAIEWERKQPAVIITEACVKCGLCRTACPPKFDAIMLNGEFKAVNTPAEAPESR